MVAVIGPHAAASPPRGGQVHRIEARGTPGRRPEQARPCASWAEALPGHDAGVLLADAGRLVVVVPHPDDGVLAAGGLIAAAAARGLPVWVLALADGQACAAGALSPSPRAVASRRAALDLALQRLGVCSGGVEHFRLPARDLQAAGIGLSGRIHRLLRSHDLVLTAAARDGCRHEAVAPAVADAAVCAGCRGLGSAAWDRHGAAADGGGGPDARIVRLDLERGQRARKLWAQRAFDRPGRTREAAAGDGVRAGCRRAFEVFVR